MADAAVQILTDENEGREKDCFEGNDKRQESEGKRIDMVHTGNSIERNPPGETDNVNPNECHTTAEPCNQPGDAV